MHYNITNKPVYPGIPVCFFVPQFQESLDDKAHAMVELFKADIFTRVAHYCLDGFYYNIDKPIIEIIGILRTQFLNFTLEDVYANWELIEQDYQNDVASGNFSPMELGDSIIAIYDEDVAVYEKYYIDLSFEMFDSLCYLILNTARLMQLNGFKIYPREILKVASGEMVIFDILSIEAANYYEYTSEGNNTITTYRERGTINPNIR